MYSLQVSVSMLEIYNEQVRDLLSPGSFKVKGGLKVGGGGGWEMFHSLNNSATPPPSSAKETACRFTPMSSLQVSVSMLEIYNEQVRDLLSPGSFKVKGGLKVREHPQKGFYGEYQPINLCKPLTHYNVLSLRHFSRLFDTGSVDPHRNSALNGPRNRFNIGLRYEETP